MSCSVIMSRVVLMFVVYLVLLYVVCFFNLGLYLCIISLCNWCDECCAFCLIRGMYILRFKCGVV